MRTQILRGLASGLGAGALIAFSAGLATAGSATPATTSHAPHDASYAAENLTDRSEAPRTGAVPPSGGSGGVTPPSTDSLRCWDAYLSGSTFAISCSGNNFYIWTDCSNGYRYTVGPFSGSYRITITCPGGSRPLQGGAYGS
ncbi:hypothetical protein GCM10010411_74010 [Actinomadura fulvescens]|uniref:Uncharacterized protein n=1 Tax=Actinomadura fulvescens TaxID=46160 RepID=A0ABP6CQV5_9ACTN